MNTLLLHRFPPPPCSPPLSLPGWTLRRGTVRGVPRKQWSRTTWRSSSRLTCARSTSSPSWAHKAVTRGASVMSLPRCTRLSTAVMEAVGSRGETGRASRSVKPAVSALHWLWHNAGFTYCKNCPSSPAFRFCFYGWWLITLIWLCK